MVEYDGTESVTGFREWEAPLNQLQASALNR